MENSESFRGFNYKNIYIYIYIYVGSQFGAQAQNVWNLGPMSTI